MTEQEEIEVLTYGTLLAMGDGDEFYRRFLKEARACLGGISEVQNQGPVRKTMNALTLHMARTHALLDALAGRYGNYKAVKQLEKLYRSRAIEVTQKYMKPEDEESEG